MFEDNKKVLELESLVNEHSYDFDLRRLLTTNNTRYLENPSNEGKSKISKLYDLFENYAHYKKFSELYEEAICSDTASLYEIEMEKILDKVINDIHSYLKTLSI